jgi:uncharacterized protein
MSEEVFAHLVDRLRRHCDASGQQRIKLTFHGGEPTLMGVQRFVRYCDLAVTTLQPAVQTEISIQTNGSRLDASWAQAFRRFDVSVGVSVDGTQTEHDRHRVDHRGRGSYLAVERGLATLRERDVRFGILSVIQLGGDPLSRHEHLRSLAPDYINYLLPDCSYETIDKVRAEHGPTPCADYLIPIFDRWVSDDGLKPRVLDFWNIAQIICGGVSHIENFGNAASHYAFVETNGDIEGLDVLRVCEDGMSQTGLNVATSDFADLEQEDSIAARAITQGIALPDDCGLCVERTTCAGGYLPHRYSVARGFNNRSVWCADILKVFRHIRTFLDISPEATLARRRARSMTADQ